MTKTTVPALTLALLAAPAPAGAERAEPPSPSADVAPDHRTTWARPRPVDAAAFGRGAGAGNPAGPAVFLSVDEDPEGDHPRDLAYTPDGLQVAVVHRDTDNVTFFSTATNAPTHTVPVGDFPVDVAVTPDGRFAVVPSVLSNDVSILDVAAHSVAATVPVTGQQPFRVAVTPDGTLAVVAVINDGISSSFSVVDLELGIEVRTFASSPQGVIGFFFTPESGIAGNIFSQFALSPDGTTIVLPDRGNDRVRIYDVATGAETATLATAALPTAVDISGDSTTAVVSHEGSARTITVIDLGTGTILSTPATGSDLQAQAIRITPDKTHAIAAISNNVIFVKLSTGATSATISTGVVGTISISSDGQYAFVTNFNARVIDIARQTLVDTIPFAPCVEGATSPTGLRAVALNNRFSERIHFYDIDGAAGFLESAAVSGVPAEGDAPYAVDIAGDGSVAVVGNLTSGNVAIVDLPAGTIRSYVEIGDRIKEVRITPDGTHAVVCSMETNEVAIIDLATDTLVASLLISNRPGRVRIAPDSSEAYVLNVAGTDRISFIELNGAASTIVAQLPAGQTGSANGPTFTETSGIELSSDGSILAVCDSFNDLLRLYDTAARTQVASVGVGDFPIRVAFSPDGTRAYVVNHFTDDVSVVEVDGPSSTLLATVSGVARYPLTVSVDPSGDFVYVGTRSSGGGANAIRVISTATNTIAATIGFGTDGSPRDSIIDDANDVLYVAATDARLVRLDANGPASVILDSTPITGGPADLALDAPRQRAITAEPIADGIDILSFAPCPEDLDGDGAVNFGDLLMVLAAWGPCPGCPEDLDGDGTVAFGDLLMVLAAWGACA